MYAHADEKANLGNNDAGKCEGFYYSLYLNKLYSLICIYSEK